MSRNGIDARIPPEGSLEILSQLEVDRLRDTSQGGLHEVLRRCSLAVLNTGSRMDDTRAIMEKFSDFEVQVVQQERGIKLKLVNAPPDAFVDGAMIRGIREHLFAVLRDIIYVSNEIENNHQFDLGTPYGITNAVFHILRNARLLRRPPLNLVVCWGGHAITREEYDYTKEVGHEMGLRDLDVCTGCGPGAMKGPMKGATIGHAKQRSVRGRYIGVTEPGIIAAEPPNPIVTDLVIMPDIEKRLEAFVRLGHGFVVFPGGVGTAEEILYLLGILLHPDNAELPFPLVFSGPASSEPYFRGIDDFLVRTLGKAVRERYRIVIDNPAEVARAMRKGINAVRDFRRARSDAYYFNWLLHVEHDFQRPFVPTHEAMASLELDTGQPPHRMAANLRRAFSGIVSGNVKEAGIRAIEEHGPFRIHGDRQVMRPLDDLLAAFVEQQRMRLAGAEYVPCYRIVA
ncbi:MAG TPA: nucleotide 5'-monophosphate nucleosidase PpnN [Gammaproteobacteria bacterium]|nr:nucleotide 5'-monophosphate nucleosidase PpnN [Gammaproteobacteria bacterium]